MECGPQFLHDSQGILFVVGLDRSLAQVSDFVFQQHKSPSGQLTGTLD
jgi:hypothetical protein